MMKRKVEFETLKGLTLFNIEIIRAQSNHDDCIRFTTIDGQVFEMYHENECCEDVHIDDICGDLNDLVNIPVLLAEEVLNQDLPVGYSKDNYHYDSWTWTFYKLSTNKGSVTIRWFGTSNGYYSENVDLYKVTND